MPSVLTHPLPSFLHSQYPCECLSKHAPAPPGDPPDPVGAPPQQQGAVSAGTDRQTAHSIPGGATARFARTHCEKLLSVSKMNESIPLECTNRNEVWMTDDKRLGGRRRQSRQKVMQSDWIRNLSANDKSEF